MTYVLIVLFLFALRYAVKGAPARARQLYPIVLLGMFVFSAFRYEVGCDWIGYLLIFMNTKLLSLQAALEQREALWGALTVAQATAELPYPWINVVTSGIFFAGVHTLARRQPDPLGFLVLIFPILIINMPMSAIRQGAAIGFMCMAYVAFAERKLIKYVAMTILASSVHSSALVFILLAPIVRGEYSKRQITLGAVASLPVLYFLLSGEEAGVATSRYVDSGLDAQGAIFRASMLFASAVIYFLMFQQEWRLKFPMEFKLVNIGSLLMLALVFVVPVSTVIADRLGYYLIPIQAMIFARMPWMLPRRNQQYLAWMPYLVLLCVFSVWTWLSALFQLCYVPYGSWLFGFPDDTRYPDFNIRF